MRLPIRLMNGATYAIHSAIGRVVQVDVLTLGGRSRIRKNGVQFDDDPSHERSNFGSIEWGSVFSPITLLHRENGRRMSEDQHVAARRSGDARRCVVAVRARCEGSRENTNAAVERLDRSAPSDSRCRSISPQRTRRQCLAFSVRSGSSVKERSSVA